MGTKAASAPGRADRGRPRHTPILVFDAEMSSMHPGHSPTRMQDYGQCTPDIVPSTFVYGGIGEDTLVVMGDKSVVLPKPC